MRLTVLEVTVAGNRMEAIRSDTQQDSEPPTRERIRGYKICNIKLNNFPKYNTLQCDQYSRLAFLLKKIRFSAKNSKTNSKVEKKKLSISL